MASKKKPKERYLKIPYHILNIRGIGLCEKNLLAHIYSFGAKGCWQSNDTLAEFFMVSPRTITIWIANLRRSELIQIKCPKGYYRTIWAKAHPDVRAASQLWYRNKKIPNPDKKTSVHRAKSCAEHGKKLRTDRAKSRNRPRKILRTTNNKTIRETTADTTATPSPLPAGGQAPALLDDRKQTAQAQIEQFKRSFGLGRGRASPTLTEEDFENRRQAQLKALLSKSPHPP